MSLVPLRARSRRLVRSPWSCAAALLGLVLLLAGVAPASALPPIEPLRRCQALLGGFTKDPQALASQTQIGRRDEPAAVRFDWVRRDPGTAAPQGWIICWFLPRTETEGQWQSNQLDSDQYGRLTRYDIQQLNKFLRQEFRGLQRHAKNAAADPAVVALLHLAQQAINALSLGALYGLIAIGFTLAFAASGVFNLAYGTIFTIGAFQAYLAYLVGERWLGGGWYAVVPVILALALAGGAAASWASDRLAFRPIGPVTASARGRQTALVAATGLLIAMQEGLRLVQGAKTRWLPYRDGNTWTLVDAPGFELVLSRGHLVVLLASVVLVFLLSRILTRTRFGLSLRAVSDDPRGAALMGVSVPQAIGFAFLLGGGLAGIAGGFAFLHYGAVNFHIGLLTGFKALAAAILGGIGSVPGALLGGLVIALVEAAAAALGLSAWKDVLVFLLLVGVLALRPDGLLGRSRQASPEFKPV
jgi:branched-chain amino acid transport system permease protein